MPHYQKDFFAIFLRFPVPDGLKNVISCKNLVASDFPSADKFIRVPHASSLLIYSFQIFSVFLRFVLSFYLSKLAERRPRPLVDAIVDSGGGSEMKDLFNQSSNRFRNLFSSRDTSCYFFSFCSNKCV